MEKTSIIYTDVSIDGTWVSMDIPSGISPTHILQLASEYPTILRSRYSQGRLQVFCATSRGTEEVTALAHQLLADIALREQIASRSLTSMSDLVEGILCRAQQ